MTRRQVDEGQRGGDQVGRVVGGPLRQHDKDQQHQQGDALRIALDDPDRVPVSGSDQGHHADARDHPLRHRQRDQYHIAAATHREIGQMRAVDTKGRALIDHDAHPNPSIAHRANGQLAGTGEQDAFLDQGGAIPLGGRAVLYQCHDLYAGVSKACWLAMRDKADPWPSAYITPYQTHPEILEEPQQIAIRIGNSKLPVSALFGTYTIPLVFDWNEKRMLDPGKCVYERRYKGHTDLHV
jgi:hypothetical protein